MSAVEVVVGLLMSAVEVGCWVLVVAVAPCDAVVGSWWLVVADESGWLLGVALGLGSRPVEDGCWELGVALQNPSLSRSRLSMSTFQFSRSVNGLGRSVNQRSIG